MRYNAAYYEVIAIQQVAVARIKDKGTDDADVAKLMLSYEKLERLKREMRGVPPLAPIKLSDLPQRNQRQLRHVAEPIELTESEPKESLSPDQP